MDTFASVNQLRQNKILWMSFVGGSRVKGHQSDSSMTLPKTASTGGFLCWESDSTCVNLDVKVDPMGHFYKAKNPMHKR